MSGDIWFKLYAADTLLSRKLCKLPLEMQGVLMRLWCLHCLDGFIEDDFDLMAQRTMVPRAKIVEFFQKWNRPGEHLFLTPVRTCVGDAVQTHWVSERMNEEKDRSIAKSEAGKKSGEARRAKKTKDLEQKRTGVPNKSMNRCSEQNANTEVEVEAEVERERDPQEPIPEIPKTVEIPKIIDYQKVSTPSSDDFDSDVDAGYALATEMAIYGKVHTELCAFAVKSYCHKYGGRRRDAVHEIARRWENRSDRVRVAKFWLQDGEWDTGAPKQATDLKALQDMVMNAPPTKPPYRGRKAFLD